MRRPRALAAPGRPGLYHVCSRVVDRRVIFCERERRKFMDIIKGGAIFAGVDLVSWCLMGNHFHLLVRVMPQDSESLSDEEVLARMEHIYPEPKMRHLRGVWERIAEEKGRSGFLAPYRARMGVLSEFVKTLKQRFTQWFNCRNDREGTLWEGRFHSVLLSHHEEEDGQGLGLLARFVAGYIDLNPVRAAIVRDAGQSAWNGFGAALRGDAEGLAGIRILWGDEVTEAMDAEAVLVLHSRMLERAFFRGREQCRQESPRTGGLRRISKVEAGEQPPVPNHERRGGVENRSENEKAMVSPETLETNLLAMMGERCLALTKGHALGRRWVMTQAG